MLEPQDLRVTSYLPQSGHGAGGMTVGLTTSGIIVHHIPTGVGVSCDSERSQYANKEKAIGLLEGLVRKANATRLCEEIPLFNDSSYTYECTIQPKDTRTMAHKVNMIKEVREKAGCGLKEAKEAVDAVYGNCTDFDDVIFAACLHVNMKFKPVEPQGYCIMGDNCLCGGDTPGVRAGCFEWKSQ